MDEPKIIERPGIAINGKRFNHSELVAELRRIVSEMKDKETATKLSAVIDRM